jgi:N-acetyl-gamma-glutamyl-phosphate reductase
MNPSETTHHPTRANDFRAYKMLAHQHMAEVSQLLERAGQDSLEVSFVPHSAPMVRGILVTAQFLLPPGNTVTQLKSAIRKTYDGAPFVRIVQGSPRVAAVASSNFADIGFAVNGRQAAILVAIDNLGKGMAGQAVQNMNLALGFEETEGLWFAGGFPY